MPSPVDPGLQAVFEELKSAGAALPDPAEVGVEEPASERIATAVGDIGPFEISEASGRKLTGRDIGFGLEQIEKASHHRHAIDEPVIETDIDHIGPVLHLLAGDFEGGF